MPVTPSIAAVSSAVGCHQAPMSAASNSSEPHLNQVA